MITDETVTLAEAVGRRFDSIFGTEDDTTATRIPDNLMSVLAVDPVIRDLKSIVLSIEWEITDTLLKQYAKQLEIVLSRYKSDPVLLQMMKIMMALGRHVETRKAGAHPDSIKLMSVVFERFESVVADDGLSEDRKNELLKSSVADFKALKKRVAEQTVERRAEKEQAEEEIPAKVEPPVTKPPVTETTAAQSREDSPEYEDRTLLEETLNEIPGRTDYSGMTPHEAFALAVEELKGVIRAEFSALRAELRMWRQGQ